jgi:hypothetical protein
MPFRSQAQWRWAFANKKPWAREWADETPQRLSQLPAYTKKAATTGNFSARAGERIGGNQCRDENGNFANCEEVQGGVDFDPEAAIADPTSSMRNFQYATEYAKIIENERKKILRQQVREQLGVAAPKGGSGKISAAERKRQQREEQKRNEIEMHSAAGPGGRLGNALSAFADPDNPRMLPNLLAAQLEEAGLVISSQFGQPYLSPEGRAYLSAARSGDVFAAQEAMLRAREGFLNRQEQMARQEEAEAKRQQAEMERQIIESIEGTPFERRLFLAQKRRDDMAKYGQPKPSRAARKPAQSSSNTYGSGKVIAGSPKSTVKSATEMDDIDMSHYPPEDVLKAMIVGVDFAQFLDIKTPALNIAHKAIAGEPFTHADMKRLKEFHDVLGERADFATRENPTPSWIEYQVAGGMYGYHWIDQVLGEYERRMSRYKADSNKPRIPSLSASVEAIRGLDLQHYFKRGGSPSMLALGRKIANRKELTEDEIRSMHSYLQRHTGDRDDNWANPADPSVAYINWQLHGGDAGLSWSSDELDSMKLKREKPSTQYKADKEKPRIPSLSASVEAIRGLDLQHYFKRGGSPSMLALGRKIANRKELTEDEIRSMHSYLQRNMGNRSDDWANPADPSVAYINWQIHGGDAGLSWSSDEIEDMKLKREKIALHKEEFSTDERRQLNDDDFVLADERKFPVTTLDGVRDAIHSWGRYRGNTSFETFKKNLINLAERKGLTSALPDDWMNERKKEINFSPPAGVRSAAKRGLELRSKFNRGGTSVGIARARDLSNGKNMSPQTIRRMHSFFARHAVDKRPGWSDPSKPSNGYIAHLLWGGDAGRAWAAKVDRQLDAREKRKEYSYKHGNHEQSSHGNRGGGGGGGGIAGGGGGQLINSIPGPIDGSGGRLQPSILNSERSQRLMGEMIRRLEAGEGMPKPPSSPSPSTSPLDMDGFPRPDGRGAVNSSTFSPETQPRTPGRNDRPSSGRQSSDKRGRSGRGLAGGIIGLAQSLFNRGRNSSRQQPVDRDNEEGFFDDYRPGSQSSEQPSNRNSSIPSMPPQGIITPAPGKNPYIPTTFNPNSEAIRRAQEEIREERERKRRRGEWEPIMGNKSLDTATSYKHGNHDQSRHGAWSNGRGSGGGGGGGGGGIAGGISGSRRAAASRRKKPATDGPKIPTRLERDRARDAKYFGLDDASRRKRFYELYYKNDLLLREQGERNRNQSKPVRPTRSSTSSTSKRKPKPDTGMADSPYPRRTGPKPTMPPNRGAVPEPRPSDSNRILDLVGSYMENPSRNKAYDASPQKWRRMGRLQSMRMRENRNGDILRAVQESQRTKSKNKPNNPSLWRQAVAQAKKKYRVYPSAYANGYASQWYKKRGGTWRTEKDLREWFDEQWVDLSRPKKGGGYEPCGRKTDDMSEADYRKKYPKCVPASRAARMSDDEKRSAIRRKRDEGLPKGGKPSMVSTITKP